MQILRNDVGRRIVMQSSQKCITHALRMFCRSSVLAGPGGHILPARSLLTQYGVQRPAFITTGMQAKKPYNPKTPRYNKPHGDGIRINRRARKRVPHAYIKRREALLSTVLSHLKRQKDAETSSEGQNISYNGSTVEQDLLPVSTTTKLHDSLDQNGSGFKPEEWSSGWGNDGMSVNQLQCRRCLSYCGSFSTFYPYTGHVADVQAPSSASCAMPNVYATDRRVP